MRIAAIAVLLALVPAVTGFAQVLSEQELDYMRELFLESIGGVIDGSVVTPGTLPADRLSEKIPSSGITEADPVATALAGGAQDAADTAQSTADSASAGVASLSSSVTAIEAVDAAQSVQIAALEAQEVTWDEAAVRAEDYYTKLGVLSGFTTNLILPAIGYTTTWTVVNGLITGIVWEETP